MTTASVAPVFTERQLRAIQRILDTMDGSTQRAERQYARIRKHERKQFHGLVSLFFPREMRELPPANGGPNCIPGWASSLSQGGVGVICLEGGLCDQLWVGIHLSNDTIRWMPGRIVRCREIPEEQFFDYGIRFVKAPTKEPADGESTSLS